jgi:hypothetical protein
VTRYGVIYGNSLGHIAVYLPDNYRIIPSTLTTTPDGHQRVGFEGEDVAGWTLEDYVIPRLASGGYTVEECRSLEHVRDRTTGVMD